MLVSRILKQAVRGQRNVLGKRTVQTQSLPATAAVDILNKQRVLRPTSPHLTIYQMQLTMMLSGTHRATGLALSALLYGFSLAYLAAPGSFDSAHVVEFVGGLPDAVKYGAKTILAFPFAFHSLNGMRHLAWDSGKFLSVKGVYSTGYTVMGATTISTLALVLL